MTGFVRKSLSSVLDDGWEAFSKEKLESSKKWEARGLLGSVLIHSESGERYSVSVKTHGTDAYASEFWLENGAGTKMAVYFEDVVRLLRNGKFGISGSRWRFTPKDAE